MILDNWGVDWLRCGIHYKILIRDNYKNRILQRIKNAKRKEKLKLSGLAEINLPKKN
jgi:hypothetical protein